MSPSGSRNAPDTSTVRAPSAIPGASPGSVPAASGARFAAGGVAGPKAAVIQSNTRVLSTVPRTFSAVRPMA